MPRRALLAATALLTLACGEKPAAEADAPAVHNFVDAASGVAIQLPAIWAGRYQLSDSITAPAAGLQRQLRLQFVMSDSGVVTEPAMLTVRVFASGQWLAMTPDSAAARYGTIIARDASHTVAVTTAPGNPIRPGTADALAFDSLMMSIRGPIHASLRADTVKTPNGPGGPGSSAP